MLTQTSNRVAAWQRLREEYLRAAERYGDLIKEGYLSDEEAGARWSVVEGEAPPPITAAILDPCTSV